MARPTTTVTTFGELEEGDWILGPDGKPVQVIKAYDPHVPERMYEIEFEDGTVIQASGNHLWYIEPESDVLSHHSRLIKARSLLSSKEWRKEAEFVAASSTPYEIGTDDLLNFFDFIVDEDERYFFVKRLTDSIGPFAEETITLRDNLTGEESEEPTEIVFDARRVFQQALALAGDRKAKRRWPVIVGRVVTTDTLFSHYPEVDIPTPKR